MDMSTNSFDARDHHFLVATATLPCTSKQPYGLSAASAKASRKFCEREAIETEVWLVSESVGLGKLFSCSTQLRLKFILLINCLHFNIYKQDKLLDFEV